MLHLAGSFQRSFFFPADLQTAFAYYGRFAEILRFLPHISLARAYEADKYRVVYSTTEMGIYQVRLYSDLQTLIDPEAYVLSILPASLNAPPVKDEVGLHSLTSTGTYSSESIFHSYKDKTRIEFGLRLSAELPVPLALRLIPDSVLRGMANNIAQWRMREIAEGFIERSIRAYLAETQ
jgi:hypothetical protein